MTRRHNGIKRYSIQCKEKDIINGKPSALKKDLIKELSEELAIAKKSNGKSRRRLCLTNDTLALLSIFDFKYSN